MLPSLLAGLGLGLSLIVAIGAQNLFVLRQGLRREHVFAVALICTVSDAALILLGVSGIGLVLHAVPWLVDVVRWAGALFLLVYGLMAARRAWRPAGEALRVADDRDAADASPSATSPSVASGSARGGVAVAARRTLAPVILTCLALTWLNPHVYLDTVFLLGSVAATHGADRWWFAAGAATASALWFFGLAFGARYLGRWLSTPRAWRILDALIAVVMIALAVTLALGA
ncbi:LysE/ArgO family amino acid transporter [Microbacterium sp.]|uniref:LysE/ArgO family amino acid transporter n=1 Tax=Microbacterium sp. TaxID=51671 RepID=UPI000927714E|nr:LysE/ArgO family amino acid transporter [Microbacterium sp.]MBN9193436.1 amino acid transporter [Microbacterium sp.]OJU69115.1 MAG: amino acid transporter [Microbacterium sp. 70-38]